MSFEFPVDRTAIMLFARALRDIDPVYSDPDHPRTVALGGVIAPPTFTVSCVNWDPHRPLEPKQRPAGKAPTQRRLRHMHAAQEFEYFHPIHAGDVLTVSVRRGGTWQKQGQRGGRLIFEESIEEHVNQDGVLCVRVTRLGVVTERVATNGPGEEHAAEPGPPD